MATSATSSSSSSSDEDGEARRKFAEIAGIAAKDINDASVKNKQSKQHFSTVSTFSTSLRKTNTFNDQEITEGLTPEFKKHVAKKLSSYIDSCIEEEIGSQGITKSKKKRSGIHLFKSSKEKVTDIDQESYVKNRTKKLNKKKLSSELSDSSDDDEALARFTEAAVSGQSIINSGLAGTAAKDLERNENQNLNSESNNTKESCKHKHKKKKKKKEKLKDSDDDNEHRKRKKHKNMLNSSL